MRTYNERLKYVPIGTQILFYIFSSAGKYE